MLEEEKFLDIREKLKNLPQVQASDDFVNALQRKINLIDAENSASLHKKNVEKLEEGFFSRLFGPARNPWLIPASGFAVVLVLVFAWVFLISNNKNVLTDRQEAPQNTAVEQGSDTTGKLPNNPVTQQKESTEGRDIAGVETKETDVTNRIETTTPVVTSSRNENTDGVLSTETISDDVVKTDAPAESNLKMNTDEEESPSFTRERSAMPKTESETEKEDSSSKTTDKKKISAMKRTLKDATDIDKMGLESLQEKVETK